MKSKLMSNIQQSSYNLTKLFLLKKIIDEEQYETQNPCLKRDLFRNEFIDFSQI